MYSNLVFGYEIILLEVQLYFSSIEYGARVWSTLLELHTPYFLEAVLLTGR